MAPTLVSTVGSASANSYVAVADATTYFDERLNASEWTDASTDDKTRALIMAARRLDQETWKGDKAAADQALAWPRTHTKDPDGNYYDSGAIPAPVKHAQIELALAILNSDDDLFADTGLEGFESVTVGPLGVTPRVRDAGALPAHVRREIAHLLVGGGSQFRMERG